MSVSLHSSLASHSQSNEKPPPLTLAQTGIASASSPRPCFNPNRNPIRHTMSIRKIPHSGALEISDIVRGYLVRRVYFGFTRKQAVAAFKIEHATK